VVIVVSKNTANASIGANGQVTAGDNLTVSSLARDNFGVSATASAGDATRVSVGGAVIVSFYTNQADALVGTGTIVKVGKALQVTANAIIPNQVPAFTPTLNLALIDTALGTDRIAEQYGDGGTVGTRVSNALAPIKAYLTPILANPNQVGTSFIHAGGTAK
jgi:hypothetical protein